MRLRNITLAGIILLVLAFTVGMAGATTDQNVTGNATTGNETTTVNTTAVNNATVNETGTPAAPEDDEDEGLIGPGNALYGLKIAFENIGETFIFNDSEKLGKQVSNARHRIAEARAELKKNNTEAAEIALAQYRAKINTVNETMSKISNNDTGLINAQQMIAKHQVILGQLLASHSNSTGLQRAYNNSMELKRKFESKVEQRLDFNITKGNREITKAEKTVASVKNETPEKGTNRGKKS